MISKISYLINKSDKIRIFIFLIGSVLATFLELVSLGSIPIFLMSILNLDQANLFPFNLIKINYSTINQNDKIIFFSLLLGLVFLLKNLYLSILIYFQGVLQKRFQISFGQKMFKLYISAKYKEHISKNPSIILRSITSDASGSSSLLLSYISLCKETLVLIGIFLMLLLVDFALTLTVFFFLSLVITIFFVVVKKKIYLRSKQIQLITGLQIKTINQVLSSIKEIKLLNNEEFFLKYFKFNLNQMETNRLKNYFLVNLPRYFLETISILTLVIISLFFAYTGKSFESFIPVLSLLAVSSVRLIPSFNTISTSLASIRSLAPGLEHIYDELRKVEKDDKFFLKDEKNFQLENFSSIKLNNLNFNYPGTSNFAIENINLEIKLGKKIGILGSSGSGKTTLIDILLGLLKPSSGELSLDNINIHDHLNFWQKNIGYVPQEINLIDDTINKNIALGVDEKLIDYVLIKQICKKLGLEKIIDNLDQKYETLIGNRGIKLSGGQIQRIGIARALYFKPKILVLDESLNSLDTRSENEILENIFGEKSIKTIFFIFHNLKLFEKCDHLILIDNGKLVSHGPLEKVKNNEKYFNLITKIKKKKDSDDL